MDRSIGKDSNKMIKIKHWKETKSKLNITPPGKDHISHPKPALLSR